MAYPPSLPTVKVTGRFLAYSGVPAKGSVRFVLPDWLQGPTDDVFLAPLDEKRTLDAEGRIEILLPAFGDPAWSPPAFVYQVSLAINGKTLKRTLSLPAGGPAEVDLADVLNVEPVDPADTTSYLLASAKGAPGGVAALDEDGLLALSQLPVVDVSADWDNLKDRPATFPPSAHGHAWGEITGKPIVFPTSAPAWDTVTGKPSLYPPAAHGHAVSDVSGLTVALAAKADDTEIEALGDAIDEVSGAVALKANTADVNASLALKANASSLAAKADAADVTTALATKADASALTSGLAAKADASALTSGLAGKASTSHTHAQSDVSGLATSLAGKAATTHTHAISDTSGLQSALDAKQAAGSYAVSGHTHDTRYYLKAESDAFMASTVRASDCGFAGWTFPSDNVQAGSVLSGSGTSWVVRFRAGSATATNIVLHVISGGTGLVSGQCFASLHNDSGAILGTGAVTADQSTNWASGGLKTMPLTTAQAMTIGAWYRVRFWFNGTTGPTLSRGLSSSAAITNAGLTATTYRYATADTGLTTASAAPTTIGTLTPGAIAWWVAVS